MSSDNGHHQMIKKSIDMNLQQEVEILTPETKKEITISGSEAVLKAFLEEGVSTIFGYPGGAIMPIYDALYDYRDQLQHILVRHDPGSSRILLR